MASLKMTSTLLNCTKILLFKGLKEVFLTLRKEIVKREKVIRWGKLVDPTPRGFLAAEDIHLVH